MVTLVKKSTKRTMYFACPMLLIKVDIFLVTVDILVKVNLLKTMICCSDK
jgi:hypothetical protein